MSKLVGEKVKLAKFTDRYITPAFVEWFNDYDVNKYLMTGRTPVSAEDLGFKNDYCNITMSIMSSVSYDVIDRSIITESPAIFSNFVGLTFLNGIDWINRKAELGYVIGNKRLWGQGIASETVKLMTDYAFGRLNLHKLEAGVVDGNCASIHILEKCGFEKYTVVPEDFWLEGKYHDVHRFYKLNK